MHSSDDTDQNPNVSRLDALSRRRLWLIIAAIAAVGEVSALPYTLLFPLVTHVAGFYRVGSDGTWTLVVLGLVGGPSTPLVARIADRHGKKNVMLALSAVSAAGTVLCATASSWPLFLTGRVLEALGMGVVWVALGLIRDLLPRPVIPAAIGAVSAGLGLGAGIAPFVTGELIGTSLTAFRPVFWFLLAYIAVATVVFAVLVPETAVRTASRPDYAGAVLLAGGAALALLALARGTIWHWTSPATLGSLIGAAVLLGGFVQMQRLSSHPLIDLRALAHPRLSLVLAVAALASVATSVFALAVPIIAVSPTAQGWQEQLTGGTVAAAHLNPAAVHAVLHGDLGYGQGFTLLGYAGHLAVWGALVAACAGPACGWWGRRVGMRIPLLLGAIVLAGSSTAMAAWHTSWPGILAINTVYFAGFGIANTAPHNLIIDAVPARRQGGAAGMLAVAVGLGAAAAGAALSALQAAHPASATITVAGIPGEQSIDLTGQFGVFSGPALTLGFIIAAASSAVVFALALALRSGRSPASGGAAGDEVAPEQHLAPVAV